MWNGIRAIVVLTCAVPSTGFAQAVPDFFPFGELEVGLEVVGFSQEDVEAIETFRLDSLFAVQVRLSSRLDSAFATATSGKVGYEMTLRVCGRTVSKARIQHELTGAAVLITTGDAEEARLAADLLRNPPCSDL